MCGLVRLDHCVVDNSKMINLLIVEDAIDQIGNVIHQNTLVCCGENVVCEYPVKNLTIGQ